MAAMADSLLDYRAQFPILETTTSLISNSLGAMPRGAAEAMREYTDVWATRGVRAWAERWWMLAREVGDQIGGLLGAVPAPCRCTRTSRNVRRWLPPASISGA